jgi:hypothetical protein
MRLEAPRAVAIVALVNGLTVVIAPLLFAFIAAAHSMDAPVRPGGSEGVLLEVRDVVSGVMLLLPFAAVTAWRTGVHAGRWCVARGSGAQGIAESIAFACGLALLILLPGSLRHPAAAPPYVIFYGGLAALIGFGVGLALWITAATTLWACGWGSGANAPR